MSKADSILDFSMLLNRVLSHWPTSVETAQLSLNDKRPTLYIVIGLGNLGDSIAAKLESEIDAVLVVALNDSLTSTIRSAALFCTTIQLSSLRLSTLRENFEKRLQRALTNSDLGWSDDDVLLVKQYFLVNAQ